MQRPKFLLRTTPGLSGLTKARRYCLHPIDRSKITDEGDERVILAIGDHASWLEQEMPDALNLCRPWDGVLVVNRRDKLWFRT